MAVLGGSAAAIIMRILLCLVITAVMKVPYLKLGGGLMLVNELKGGTLRVEFIGNTLPPGHFASTGVCED